MDEGVNSYVENRVAERNNPNAGHVRLRAEVAGKAATILGVDGLNATALNQVPYQAVASRGLDQPVSGPCFG